MPKIKMPMLIFGFVLRSNRAGLLCKRKEGVFLPWEPVIAFQQLLRIWPGTELTALGPARHENGPARSSRNGPFDSGEGPLELFREECAEWRIFDIQLVSFVNRSP